MANIVRICLAVILFAVFALCAYGFLTTFEPTDRSMLGWRIAYGGVGIGALVLGVWLRSWPGRAGREKTNN